MRQALILSLSLVACGPSRAPTPPEPAPGAKNTATGAASAEGAQPGPAEDLPDEHASGCTQDRAAESPIAEVEAGTGEKYLRVENSTKSELRARVLDASGTAVVDGTLIVPPQGEAKFWVDAGEFQLRLREERKCAVFMGAPFVIRPEVKGVALTIAFEYGPDGNPLGMENAAGGL